MEAPTETIETQFLDDVFEHILWISKGDCKISNNDLKEVTDEKKLNILSGLKMLHEDLDLYKKDYKKKIEADYKLKILEKKNTQLEQFNFMASHDLKEPLRNIKNFSQLLNASFHELPKEKIKEYLSYIDVATTRMQDLLSSMLNYSIAGTELKKTRIDLDSIMSELRKDLSIIIDKAKVQFQVADLGQVYADKSAIRVVLQNLISNAIKFKSAAKDLVIKITHEKTATGDRLCVTDNGIGIAEEYFSQIFVLLKRLHTKTEIEGSGVGLSICKKLIESHEGKIWVESELGQGSKFYFELPSK